MNPASITKRVWAFIIDQLVVGVPVATAWALLALALGDPIRFEPLLPFIEQQTDCEIMDRVETRDPDGSRTQTTDSLCVTTYLDRWTSYDLVRDEQTVANGVHRTTTTYHATDARGVPIAVLTDGLVTAMFLLVYFTMLEGSGLRTTLGKFLLGLEVVSAGDGAVTRRRAFGRNLVKLMPIVAMFAASLWHAPLAAIFGLPLSAVAETAGLTLMLLMLGGFALVVVTPQRQALHDLLSGTVVNVR